MTSDFVQSTSLYPIQYQDLYEYGKKAQSLYWVSEEVQYSDDLKDWRKLSDDERRVLTYILAFFASSDSLLIEHSGVIAEMINNQSINFFYNFKTFIEAVHSETYSLFINSYITESQERDYLLNAIKTIDTVKQKYEWSNNIIKSREHDLKTRLVCDLITEGVFFSGAFCCIFWMRTRGLLHNLCFANSLILRDENMHCEYSCMIYNKLTEKLTESQVHDMFNKAVDIEITFVNDAIPCYLLGMNASLMGQYVKYCADTWIVKLGYNKLYNIPNPFPFMEMIAIEGKSNFFERKVSEYASSKVNTSEDKPIDINELSFNEVF